MSDYVKQAREVEEFLRECEDDGLLLDIWNDFCDESSRIYNIDCEFNDVMESDFTPSEMWEIFTNSSNFSVNDTYFRVVDCCTEIQSSDDILNLIDDEEIENLSDYIVQNKKDYGWNELKAILNPYGLKKDNEGYFYKTAKRNYRIYNLVNDEKVVIFAEYENEGGVDEKYVNWLYVDTIESAEEYISKAVIDYELKEKGV